MIRISHHQSVWCLITLGYQIHAVEYVLEIIFINNIDQCEIFV